MDRIKNRYFNMVRFFVRHGLLPFSAMVSISSPFLCIMHYRAYGDLKLSFVFASVLIIVSFLIRLISDSVNAGKIIPIPYKRFTVEDEYDGITVNRTDIEEMIVFMNDYENWLDRNGIVNYRKHKESSRDA